MSRGNKLPAANRGAKESRGWWYGHDMPPRTHLLRLELRMLKIFRAAALPPLIGFAIPGRLGALSLCDPPAIDSGSSITEPGLRDALLPQSVPAVAPVGG